jgi:hypothetical protein
MVVMGSRMHLHLIFLQHLEAVGQQVQINALVVYLPQLVCSLHAHAAHSSLILIVASLQSNCCIDCTYLMSSQMLTSKMCSHAMACLPYVMVSHFVPVNCHSLFVHINAFYSSMPHTMNLLF